MGLTVKCDNESFSCSYGNWNRILITVIYATIEYMEKYNYSTTEEELYEKESLSILTGYYKRIPSEKFANKDWEWLCNCFDIEEFINSLIYFDIKGLYCLCNQGEKDRYFSIGDSYDIWDLFSKIKPFIPQTIPTYISNSELVSKRLSRVFSTLESQENNNNINVNYEAICQLEKVFQESVLKDKKITLF